ncbi:MAG TPA: multiheme c-type cytochrome, partial [Chitinophagaceae bacterium]|nr:multiheme c-type cytochrome [Chitinophagaceae bacterium]
NSAEAGNKYVGDEACKSCHTKQYNDWLQSDHFKSLQTVNDTSVLGNFNNASLQADGVTSSFNKKNGYYFINTQGDDGKNHNYKIAYTFGYYPLQQYVVAFANGKMQVTRQSWNSKSRQWFQQYAGQKINYKDWLHWTGNAQNWNTMCAECHSTNLKKNYNIETDSYNTQYSVINVSCEACHGPGKQHIEYVNSNDYKKGNRAEGSHLVLSKKATQNAEINVCAPCHSVQTNISDSLISSDELLDNHIPLVPNTERFYADGQVKEEDYNYASFLQSKMYSRGVKCSSCHNVHTGKLYLTGNQTCLQCHAKQYDSPTHHFHQINTETSSCINCHAPGKIYMGNDLRHDHSFRVPRPDLSVKYSTPNACNNCHNNQSYQWATAAIEKWYGVKRKSHFSEDLIEGSLLNNTSEQHLQKVISDTASPAIIKATAIGYLGNIKTQTSLQTILQNLKNNNTQIRYEALKSLITINLSFDKSAVTPLLYDKVRAVRIAAAEVLNIAGTGDLQDDELKNYDPAKNEFEKYLLYQADFAHGNINIGDYYFRNKNYENAEKFYLRSLLKDSLANIARLNLASVYNLENRKNDAVKMLSFAAKIDAKNDETWISAGLLYLELKDFKNAAAAFDNAFKLNSPNSRLYYNYALLLDKMHDNNKAVAVLEKGLQQKPDDESLNYLMVYILMQQKDKKSAKKYAVKLQAINNFNPTYRQIFAQLGLL